MHRTLLTLLLVACGEKAYYPSLQPALDTAVVEVDLVCGDGGTPIGQQVEVISTWDGPVRVAAVDVDCRETSLGQLDAFETATFTSNDRAALAAYALTPSGEVRIAARQAVPTLSSTKWVVP